MPAVPKIPSLSLRLGTERSRERQLGDWRQPLLPAPAWIVHL
jgi:hypothetical protein